MSPRFAIILALAITLIPACSNKKKKAPTPGAEPAASSQVAHLKQLQQVLSIIPAGTASLVVVLDWEPLLRASADLQGALKHTGSGQALLDSIHDYSASAPVPLPIGRQELGRLGLDAAQPMAVFGAESPVAIFSLKDPSAFQKQLAAAYGKGKWKDVTHDGLKLRQLTGTRTLSCLPMDRRHICSPSPATLAQAVKVRPQQSVWNTLSEDERADLARATALVGVNHPKRLQARAMLRVEDDGLSARVRGGGPAMSQFTALLGGKGGSAGLLDLAGNAPTAIYLRARVNGVLNALRALLPDLRQLDLDPIRLQASLTGEVLLRETADRKLLLVLGSHDLAVSRSVVEALAKLLKKGQEAGGSPLAGVPMTITPTGDKDHRLYQITASPRPGGIPLELKLGLAASGKGVLLGAVEAVKELAGEAKGKSAGKGNESGAQVLAMARTPLADPLRRLGAAADVLFKTAGLPEGVMENIRLARFLLDQLHGQEAIVTSAGSGQVLLDMRWRTLHQRGVKGSDAARDLWIKGLTAFADGEADKAKRLLGNLVKEHGESRFAARAKEDRPGMLASLFTSLLTSTALPAYKQYLRRSMQAEAVSSLARLSMAGRFTLRSTGVAPRGSAMPKEFPKSSDWTPPKPCCGYSGGLCQPAPGVWMTPTWKALKFEMERAHRFQYRFVNKGKVKGRARFIVQARGDLECKGQTVTFTIEGTEQEDGTVSLSPMKAEATPAR